MDPLLILLFLIFSSFVGGTLGFGDSLILIPLVGLILDTRTAVVLVSFWGILLSCSNAINYRKFFDKQFLKKNLIPGIPGVILGSLLIVTSPLNWINIVLGTFVLAFVGYKFKKIYRSRKADKAKSVAQQSEKTTLPDSVIMIGGFTYAFLGGLIGASGPINVILLERTGHYRESFIGNFAITSVLLSTIKVGIYLANGLFPIDLLPIYLLGIPIVFIVTKIGHIITPKIPKDKFQLIVLVVLLIIAVRLIITTVLLYFP
jgi:uncharacterized membrane protein YfcA